MTKSRSRIKKRLASHSAGVDLARLRRGVQVGRTGTRVRLAVDGDRPVVRTFLCQALGKSPGEDAAYIPTVCPTIEAALQGGQQAFTRELATQLVRRESDGPVSFGLVAENPSGQPVGAVVCAPPYGLIAQYIMAVPAAARQQVELQGMLGLSKVIGVAVDPSAGGQGIGTELVLTAEQVLSRTGAFVMYGNCAPAVRLCGSRQSRLRNRSFGRSGARYSTESSSGSML